MIEPPAKRPQISVQRFLEAASEPMKMTVLAGEGSLSTEFLDSPRVQKLGLVLSGFTHRIHQGRIQIFGNSERHFLSGLSAAQTGEALSRLEGKKVSCVLITAGNSPSAELLSFAAEKAIPLLATPLPSSEAITCIADILGHELAPVATVHGVLLEVFGVGVLIRGESGIGKSECALDLIGRGHRLVSDDAVLMRRVGERVYGEPPEIIRDHLEIRGLGIINARELFGVSALAGKVEIQLCLDFVSESESLKIDRLATDGETSELLGVEIRKFVLPVRPGRNLATLAETAVRVFVSERSSKNSAQDLIERHDKAIGSAVQQ